MSADTERTPAPTEPVAVDESHSHKRKASEEPQNHGSPKRSKLDTAHTAIESTLGSEAKPREEEPHPSPANEQFAGEDLGHKSRAISREVDSNSRSPTLSRRPSIPTPDNSRRPSGPGPDRTRNRINEEEKKRGQRLFGGLLGALSRKPDGSQQRKRQDVERRQKERAQAIKAEDEQRRSENYAKLTHIRKVEQVNFDEQVMDTRHSDILALAQGFSTKSEPTVYYVPWKLTKTQEATLTEQKRKAEELVAKEKADFARQKVQRLKELGVTVSEPEPSDATNEQVPNETERQSPPMSAEQSNANVPNVDGAADGERRQSKTEKEHDDQGVMVEAAEDTVIY